MDGLQRPPGYRASHGHARYKSHLSPQVDTVSSVEIAHQLHRGVEINTFKLATFVKVEERGMKSRQRFNTHTHMSHRRGPLLPSIADGNINLLPPPSAFDVAAG